MSTRLDLSKLSLMDALDLATLIEVEAHERYTYFAAQLGRRGGFDPGLFFASMAENEAKHGQQLAARRKALFGDTPPRVKLDDLYDVEAPEFGSARRTMSTKQAFEVAIAAEQKAYDFYDSALPTITDPEVRELFIELRDEETEHVEMVREAMAKLPESASFEDEIDIDESPYL
jgi:rubrerythrin